MTVAEKQENHWELLVLYWITGLLKWIIWNYALCLYLLSWAMLPNLCAYTCSQGLRTGPPTPTPRQEQPLRNGCLSLTSLPSPILCKFSPWSLQLMPLINTVMFCALLVQASEFVMNFLQDKASGTLLKKAFSKGKVMWNILWDLLWTHTASLSNQHTKKKKKRKLVVSFLHASEI